MREDRPGCLLAPRAAPDAELVARVREGDRIAFGVLYLRHHAAAWRLASACSGFSDDAELALMTGFSDVFSKIPRTGDPAFRSHLLTCVRRAAVDRSRGRRPGRVGPEAAGAGEDGDIGIAVRAALAAVPETSRAALWLTDVEAMTPAEVGALLGIHPGLAAWLADDARARVRAAVAEAPLADAAAPAPLLGGECQRYWLSHRRDEEGVGVVVPRAARRRRAPIVAVATAVAAMVLGLPSSVSVPPDGPTTVAVSPAVRGYMPGTAVHR